MARARSRRRPTRTRRTCGSSRHGGSGPRTGTASLGPDGSMKAVVYDRYGPPDVLRIEDVPKPAPAPDEVLVRIRATGVTRSDAHLRTGEPFVSRFQSGLLQPKRKILGHELAGEVEAVGAAVTEFEVGDRVFGALPYLVLKTGAHAEYMCVPERFPLTR